MGVLGSIFGFGDALKRRLKDAASNPRDFAEMAVDQNQNEWRKNPDERAMGFFNPVPLGTMGKFVMDSQAQKIVDQLSKRFQMSKTGIPMVENSIYPRMPGQPLKDTKYVQRNVREQAELDSILNSGYLLPKEGGKPKKYFSATDEVNPRVPEGNTMLRIARERVKSDEAVSAKDVERYNFSTNSWEPLIKEAGLGSTSRNHALKPKSSSLPQEAIDQALRDYPEVPKELLTKYMNQAYKTGIAEKTSNPDTWTQLQRTMHDAGDWKGFSKSRGYTEKEIADFDEMISLHGQLSKYLPEKKMPNGEVWDDLGSIDAFLINPHIDAAKEAAANPIQSESRRSFLKKSAGIAGGTAAMSIPGAKLLRKFAPEERAIAKQATVKQAAVEAAPKYKYNSLKDYLDDVNMAAKEEFKASEFERMGVGADSAGFPMTRADFTKKILHEDEAGYEASKFFYKDNLKDPKTGKWINPYDGQPHSEEFLKNIRNTVDDFSPQAKKEMGEFKSWADVAYDGDWATGAMKEFSR